MEKEEAGLFPDRKVLVHAVTQPSRPVETPTRSHRAPGALHLFQKWRVGAGGEEGRGEHDIWEMQWLISFTKIKGQIKQMHLFY